MARFFLICAVVFLLLTGFVTDKNPKPVLPKEFVFIQGGTWYRDTAEEEPRVFDPSKRIAVPSFYISQYEVTNKQYRDFLNDIASTITKEELKTLQVDSLGWRLPLTYCKPMVVYYFRHPAYNDYPVVNISWESAMRYCKWLEQKLQKENERFTVKVSLPGKNAWKWAASGPNHHKWYPWAGTQLMDKEGNWRCNFKRIGEEAVTRNKESGNPEIKATAGYQTSTSFFTAAVKSFKPNDFKLYNMSGNVAEMIAEKGIALGGSWSDYGGDVTIHSETKYEAPSPTIGFRPVIVVEKKTK